MTTMVLEIKNVSAGMLEVEGVWTRMLEVQNPRGRGGVLGGSRWRGCRPGCSRSRILEVEEVSVRMLEVQHHVTRGRGGVGQARILLGTDILNPHSNCY